MNTKNWKLKDVLLIAISAVLFGVVYLGCTYIGGVLYGMLTPFGMASLGYEPFYGIYFMAGAFGIYVMRKPGTGLIAELLAIMLVVRIISAIVFDGFITPMLADGLVKAGVLKGYAVAQAQDADLED